MECKTLLTMGHFQHPFCVKIRVADWRPRDRLIEVCMDGEVIDDIGFVEAKYAETRANEAFNKYARIFTKFIELITLKEETK